MGRVIKANALRNYQNYKNKILSPLMTNVRQVPKRVPYTFIFRSSSLVVFLGKGVLIICSKFRGENPYRNVVSIKLQSNFIEITLRYGCSLVNLLHIFRTPILKNTSRGSPSDFQQFLELQLNWFQDGAYFCYLTQFKGNFFRHTQEEIATFPTSHLRFHVLPYSKLQTAICSTLPLFKMSVVLQRRYAGICKNED